MPEVRSRNGCTTCKRRRRKCDEARPSCGACLHRNFKCEYNDGLRWGLPNDPEGFVSRRQRQRRTEVSRTGRSRSAIEPVSPVEPSLSGQETVSPAVGFASDTNLSIDEQLILFSQESPEQPRVSPQNIFNDALPADFHLDIPTYDQLIVSNEDVQAQDESHANESHGSDENENNENCSKDDDADEESGEDEQADDEDLGWALEDEELWLRVGPEHFDSPGDRIAFAYWVKYLSGILPALDSATNPYRRLSYIALSSPVLLNTIISLATEYMYCHGRAAPEITLQRHQRALNSLREALVSTSPPSRSSSTLCSVSQGGRPAVFEPQQATLAAVLLQVANVVFTGGSGVDVHLSCAMHFMQTLGYIDEPVQDPTARLLVQRFAMLDVITSTLRRRRPHLPSNFWLFIPNGVYDRTQPSFREMTGCPQPVLGFLARLANLVVDQVELDADASPESDEYSEREFDILRLSSTLESDMRIYARSRVTFSSSRRTSAQHLDTLSQCFYWAAHLILQRSVYRDPPTSPRVQQTVANMVRCMKSMPVGCGPDTSLPFPFYLSSREAVTESHREWVRSRNARLKQLYPGRLRDTIMNSLEKVWEAIDEGRQDRDARNREVDERIRSVERERDFCLF